jgi:hypothetical protein
VLDLVRGDLSIHLDMDFHYPVLHAQAKYPPSALCQWALNDDNSRDSWVHGASVSCCDKCYVILCLPCFKLFHTITDISKLQSEIRKNHDVKEK